MPSRATLEKLQVAIYLVAIGVGAAIGRSWPAAGATFEAALWPVLALLLYATFVQVPLLHLRNAFADRRFVAAVVVGNFVLVPLVAAAAVHALPPDPALRLGVLLVLLVPCTDWFVTFCALGGGNLPRAIAVTPLNLLLQLLLLPAYLWALATPADGADSLAALTPAVLAPALAIVLAPLAAAAFSERWIERAPAREVWRERLAWSAVPLLALVVLLIAGAQVGALVALLPRFAGVVPLFVAYLLAAAVLAWALAKALRLGADQARTLAYSLGTRNSFLVLPLALALPAGWELAAMVIVVQSLVELFGMLAYLAWLPRLFPLPAR